MVGADHALLATLATAGSITVARDDASACPRFENTASISASLKRYKGWRAPRAECASGPYQRQNFKRFYAPRSAPRYSKDPGSQSTAAWHPCQIFPSCRPYTICYDGHTIEYTELPTRPNGRKCFILASKRSVPFRIGGRPMKVGHVGRNPSILMAKMKLPPGIPGGHNSLDCSNIVAAGSRGLAGCHNRDCLASPDLGIHSL